MRVGYIGLKVDKDIEWVKKHFPFAVLDKEFFHHLTVWFKPPIEAIEEFKPLIGNTYSVCIEGYYADEDINCLVCKVDLPVQNAVPHITVSCRKGVSPAYSNKVLSKGFTSLDSPLYLDTTLFEHYWK